MDIKIEKIYLTVEHQLSSKIDYEKEYTDVIVRLNNDHYYAASFFTFKSLEAIRVEHKLQGEYLGGKFFWVEGMVLIDNCSKENIEKVIHYLIEEGDFHQVFRKI